MDSRSTEGWFNDPYGIHQHRWFSDGTPSALVRDDGAESNNPPPDVPTPGPPTEITAPGPTDGSGDDLLRAGDEETTDPHDSAMGMGLDPQQLSGRMDQIAAGCDASTTV